MAECDPPDPPPLLRQPESRQLSMNELIQKHEREVAAQREFFGEPWLGGGGWSRGWGGGCLVLIVCAVAVGAGLAAAVL